MVARPITQGLRPTQGGSVALNLHEHIDLGPNWYRDFYLSQGTLS